MHSRFSITNDTSTISFSATTSRQVIDAHISALGTNRHSITCPTVHLKHSSQPQNSRSRSSSSRNSTSRLTSRTTVTSTSRARSRGTRTRTTRLRRSARISALRISSRSDFAPFLDCRGLGPAKVALNNGVDGSSSGGGAEPGRELRISGGVDDAVGDAGDVGGDVVAFGLRETAQLGGESGLGDLGGGFGADLGELFEGVLVLMRLAIEDYVM